MNRLVSLVIFALVFLAAVPRVAGVYGDFWLDEIWSWRIAANVAAPKWILLHPVARYDNNHPLNTLTMWLSGHHVYSAVYRVPAVMSGIGTIVVAAIVLRRRGVAEMFAGVLLVGFAYPLVIFSSEARGYAPAVFFALVAFDALDRYLRSRGWFANLAFVLACVLGIAAHLTFVYFWAAAVVWTIARFARERRRATSPVDGTHAAHSHHEGVGVLDYGSTQRGVGWFGIMWHLLRLHLVPAAALALLYWVFIRHLTIGGAPDESILSKLRGAIGNLLGAGDSTPATVVLLLVVGALFVASLRLIRRSGDDLWIFLVGVIVAPIVIVGAQLALVERRQPVEARYFLVAYAFVLLAVAMLLGHWLRQHDRRRTAAILLLAGFLALNLYHTVRFLRVGRGQYQEAVLYMVERSGRPVITVLSDHPLRTAMVLDYYRRVVPPNQQLVIYDGSGDAPSPWTHGPPVWLIVHSNKRNEPPGEFAGFVFDREFTYYGLSGYSWYLYRNRTLK